MPSKGLALAEIVDPWADAEHVVPTRPKYLSLVKSPDALVVDAPVSDLGRQFEIFAAELSDAAGVVSSTRRLMRHPAYLAILALGERAIPLILKRIEAGDDQPVWLRLLGSFTSFQPGAGQETIADAAAAWVRWGKVRGILS
jgi:hypothetical protein